MERRFFTVSEANQLIPFLTKKLKSLQRVGRALQDVSEAVAPDSQDIAWSGGIPVEPQYFQLLSGFQSDLGDICAEGCQIKDVESGLIDFPTVWAGREVYLCWQLGESEVSHWHEVEAGFSGRQALESATTDEGSA